MFASTANDICAAAGTARRGGSRHESGGRTNRASTCRVSTAETRSYGPDRNRDEPQGKALGIIAIGDEARGWLALGDSARGYIALGRNARGVIAPGGKAMGLVALGGIRSD
jgi:hypothetical protein